jgi:hypothetical protein
MSTNLFVDNDYYSILMKGPGGSMS